MPGIEISFQFKIGEQLIELLRCERRDPALIAKLCIISKIIYKAFEPKIQTHIGEGGGHFIYERTDYLLAHHFRQAHIPMRQLLRLERRIPHKKLVRSISSQRHCHTPARKRSQKIDRTS